MLHTYSRRQVWERADTYRKPTHDSHHATVMTITRTSLQL